MGIIVRIEGSLLYEILQLQNDTKSDHYTTKYATTLKIFIHQLVTNFLSCDHQLSILYIDKLLQNSLLYLWSMIQT